MLHFVLEFAKYIDLSDSHLSKYVFLKKFDFYNDFSEDLIFAGKKNPFKDGFKDIQYLDQFGNVKIKINSTDLSENKGLTDYGKYDFKEGFAAYKLDLKFGFIDKKGVVRINPKYSDVTSFSNGCAAVALDENWGCIDHNDKIVIPFLFSDVGKMDSNGFIPVQKNAKWGIIVKPGFDALQFRVKNILNLKIK